MSDSDRPVSRYERSGDYDEFLVGIVGEAEDDGASYVEVRLLSEESDPVGWVMLTGVYRDGDETEGANVILDGHQTAMLALVLQDAARQWHDRDVSHHWKERD